MRTTVCEVLSVYRMGFKKDGLAPILMLNIFFLAVSDSVGGVVLLDAQLVSMAMQRIRMSLGMYLVCFIWFYTTMDVVVSPNITFVAMFFYLNLAI